MHLVPDGTFPEAFGVPNPKRREMVEETFDTDAITLLASKFEAYW